MAVAMACDFLPVILDSFRGSPEVQKPRQDRTGVVFQEAGALGILDEPKEMPENSLLYRRFVRVGSTLC